MSSSIAIVRSRAFFLCNDGKLYTCHHGGGPGTGTPVCVASGITSASGGLSLLACVSDGGSIVLRDYDPWAVHDFGEQFGFFQRRCTTGTTARFIAVACGDIHAVALDDAGALWTMGMGPATGVLPEGYPSYATTKFRRICAEGFQQGRIRVVAAGSQHSAAVCSEGTLYTWGVNTSGELGVGPGSGAAFAAQPAPVPGLRGVCGVALGWHFSAAWTGSGLWTAGSGNFGQLGLGDREDRAFFARVRNMPGPLRHVDCGLSWTLAIDVHGGVWSTGRGKSMCFKRVAGAPTNCVHVCAGDSRAIGLTGTGSVFEWASYVHPGGVFPVPFMGDRIVGRWCHRELATDMVLALFMALHPRLGARAALAQLEVDLLHHIVQAAAVRPRV